MPILIRLDAALAQLTPTPPPLPEPAGLGDSGDALDWRGNAPLLAAAELVGLDGPLGLRGLVAALTNGSGNLSVPLRGGVSGLSLGGLGTLSVRPSKHGHSTPSCSEHRSVGSLSGSVAHCQLYLHAHATCTCTCTMAVPVHVPWLYLL
jgi:hypothetical protein